MTIVNVDECLRRIRVILPEFSFLALLAETGKSKVLCGTNAGQPIVIKMLCAEDVYWRAKFLNEINTYRAFAGHRPPVTTPKMLYSDEKLGLLVFEQIAAAPLASTRYPPNSIGKDCCAKLVADLENIARYKYHFPDGSGSAAYCLRKARHYETDGILNHEDLHWLELFLSGDVPEMCFSHGDFLPANCLIGRSGEFVYADWEFAGYRLPDYDLALLWISLGNDPYSRDMIIKHVMAKWAGRPHSFCLNLFLLLARETRIHREPSVKSFAREILEMLAVDLDWVRATTVRMPGVI